MPYTGDVSVNRYLQKAGKGFFIRPTAAIWGRCLTGAINSVLPQEFNPGLLPEKKPFSMDLLVKFPRRFSSRSGDAPNFDKFIRDVVASTLGVDDASSDGEPKGTYGNGDESSIEIVIAMKVKHKTIDLFEATLCLV